MVCVGDVSVTGRAMQSSRVGSAWRAEVWCERATVKAISRPSGGEGRDNT